jgi:ATP-dependent protease ClpP protease subunit
VPALQVASQAATAADGPSDKAQLAGLLQAIESERKSRVVVYWTSDIARVSDAAVVPLYDQLAAAGQVEKLDLVLYTRGGDTEVPWRMVTLIREFAEELAVLIPHRASSAGTLLAMGANEIVMTPLAALGPIDPSRTHPLLPKVSGGEPEPVSVQDMRHAMQFIREAGGNDKEMPYTPEAMAQIFTALFEKLHPLAIGAIEQSYALSKLIGRRCLETHMDPKQDEAKIGSIVDKLCDDYKSHAYQISRSEARGIGLNVVDASAPVEKALMDIWKLYMARPVLPAVAPAVGTTYQSYIAWLDSDALNMRVEGNFVAAAGGKLEPQGDRWVSY